MPSSKQKNVQDYWQGINVAYKDAWKTPAQLMMSDKELGFIAKHLSSTPGKAVLDIGIGVGRILQSYVDQKVSSIYGVDVSAKLVKYCQQKFAKEKSIKKLATVNIAKSKLDLSGMPEKFDLISCVRVLQYNENWSDIIDELVAKLGKDGILVFSMLNKYSLNSINFLKKGEAYRTSIGELKKLIAEKGLELIEMRTFTRLPDIFYIHLGNRFFTPILNLTEKFYSLIFGRTLFGRIIFMAVRKG